MAEVRMKLDRSLFDQWVQEVLGGSPAALDRILMRAADITEDHIVRNAPELSGAMKRSVRIQRVSQDTVIVGPTVPYAPFVERGTGPHEIRPVNAEALRFEIGGEVIFAKRVMHPGFQGRYFMRQSREDAIPEVRAMAVQELKRLYEVS